MGDERIIAVRVIKAVAKPNYNLLIANPRSI